MLEKAEPACLGKIPQRQTCCDKPVPLVQKS